MYIYDPKIRTESFKESFEIHKIKTSFLKSDGILIKKAIDRFYNDLMDCVLVIGHNINFDIRRIIYECELLEDNDAL